MGQVENEASLSLITLNPTTQLLQLLHLPSSLGLIPHMLPFNLKQSLRAGDRVFGTLVISESPLWPRAIATTGLDFVFIDTEHTALTTAQVAGMCQSYRGLELPPIVRIPSPDPTAAAKMLDIGACGVIAPYVESRGQALELAGAVRFRPLKGQRLQSRLAGEELEPELESYLKHRNDPNLLILNIESTPAIEALDEILSVPGIDAVLIGPHDLSCSLGMPEQYDDPEFLAACQSIFATGRKHGVGAGIHFMGSVEQQVRFLELGANMLIHSADVVLIANHLRSELSAIRAAVGEKDPSAFGDVEAI